MQIQLDWLPDAVKILMCCAGSYFMRFLANVWQNAVESCAGLLHPKMEQQQIEHQPVDQDSTLAFLNPAAHAANHTAPCTDSCI